LELPGYTEEEKTLIAEKHLLPKQTAAHGLILGTDIAFEKEAIVLLIRNYTREAGLRNLEREIATICRKVARRRAEGDASMVAITPELVGKFLGAPKFLLEELEERTRVPGVAVGLAWTPSGGDVLFIEATRMNGGKTLTLTGQLGDVMKESAQAALSWVRSHAETLGIDPEFWERGDIHIHVPSGAIPKDGPSAGVTIATAIVSLLTGRPVRPNLAMTGEITLSGRVLPVGGIKEKVLAATRVGIKEVILPKRNEKNLFEDVPPAARESLTVHLVSTIEEIIDLAFAHPIRRPQQTVPEVSGPLLLAEEPRARLFPEKTASLDKAGG
jgi:ATP-dependent Lon protease